MSKGGFQTVQAYNFESKTVDFDLAGRKIIIGRLESMRPKSSAMGSTLKLHLMRKILCDTDFAVYSCADLEIRPEPLGKPVLFVKGVQGPPVSFTWGLETLWAAAGVNCRRLGVDCAHKGEFPENYPFGRVFTGGELEGFKRFLGSCSGRVASLLWSIKEAAVKMHGSGFHGVDPKDVEARPEFYSGKYFLSRATNPRLAKSDQSINVFSIEAPGAWLSIAMD
jgi:hypothetical protein